MELIQKHQPMADAIAALLYPYAEVVLHDLKSQTVVYVANNFSKRSIGDNSGLDTLGTTEGRDVIGPYTKLNWDGRTLHSISVMLKDHSGAAEGLLCINLDVTVFANARAALDLFLAGTKLEPQPEELFRDDWQERINAYVHTWLQEHQLSLSILAREQKRELVIALHGQGAFRGKSAANYVASILNMGRATVFKYLKESKESS
ncbi:helix-turn-helix transcriptional regulator [Paludibacterium purpuratum]|uniref:Putative transcriptional regulator YheO n=1 Tax=Paludibacterium purpuratum TaxID=1144873 RepID=A0A4R7AYR7_9NEIS|nr:PAS domain-containing protein [Paludibacterium purpuratum]TDR73079.1 putative transcriptional regulator YheO [Paludibacterium purpuratum]